MSKRQLHSFWLFNRAGSHCVLGIPDRRVPLLGTMLASGPCHKPGMASFSLLVS